MDLSIEQLNRFTLPIKAGFPIILDGERINSDKIWHFEIWETIEREQGKSESSWDWIVSQGRNATNDFIAGLPLKPSVHKTVVGKTKLVSRKKAQHPSSKRIFIVHGRDHEAVKELKAMLSKFGLNPVVLHEQPSGSMTIVEKLEKYSDVGYAFVLLTPDDALVPTTEFIEVDKKHGTMRPLYIYDTKPVFRARQNVILEFGYFIAKVGRNRVCCLYKEDTQLPYDLPSDMHGIVYISFKESISEKKDMIIKELKEAGYEIKEISEETKKWSSQWKEA